MELADDSLADWEAGPAWESRFANHGGSDDAQAHLRLRLSRAITEGLRSRTARWRRDTAG